MKKKNVKVSPWAAIRNDWGKVKPYTQVHEDKRKKKPKHKGREQDDY